MVVMFVRFCCGLAVWQISEVVYAVRSPARLITRTADQECALPPLAGSALVTETAYATGESLQQGPDRADELSSKRR